MCMLCVVPKGVIPSREKLENSALNNPHGFGFAIVIPSENRIISERSMDADESINRFLKLRNEYPEGYAMWHARYATHGSRNIENCHPFTVGKDKRTYLAHNGILDIDIKAKDDRSDTRVFAEELLPTIGGVKSLDNDHVWDMICEFASGSKICILTVDPKAEHQCYIINQDLGREDNDGVWWSNDSCYLTETNYLKPTSAGYYNGEFDFDTLVKKDTDIETTKTDDSKELANFGEYYCPNEACGALLDEEDFNVYCNTCMYCGYCFDCMLEYENCFCYNKPYEYYHGSKKAKKEFRSRYNDYAF